ncbi:MAG: type I methionyl aminopeptidase [bacterium]|nr:type I methionyl aminopeptidase [bacterium]
MIPLKTVEEIKHIRESGLIVAGVLDKLSKAIEPGIKTIDLDRIASDFIHSKKAESAFLGFKGFPKSICVSINNEVIHGIPNSRMVEAGDIVSLDVGVFKDGYYADAAVTVAFGEIKADAERLVNTTREALAKGIEKSVTGNRLGDISWAVQYYTEKSGFSIVRQFVGHGIGRQLHEEPQIPNFGSPGQGPKLKEGMVLAIEPMVNFGGYEVEICNDGWTAVTKDRSLSAHFEHTVAITNNGPVIMTSLE